MLNMVLQLDNDCEGLFYISLKYRRDKDIIYTLYVFISIYFFLCIKLKRRYTYKCFQFQKSAFCIMIVFINKVTSVSISRN